MQGSTLEFRPCGYRFIRELGQGACGKTILLHDDMIDEHFVCKKYSPQRESHRKLYYENFTREIKLLYQVYHHNVVRVFNHYLYPDQFTGYILMEYIDGVDIEEYLGSSPEKVNEIFLQAIEGFCYLETNQILHRDIRPGNLMIREDGLLKIIDLGFAKNIKCSDDFGKSISLNWHCDELPGEFKDAGVYDFRSEVYFIGKLFERIIEEKRIAHFKYTETLKQMCRRDPGLRVQSFFDVEKCIQGNKFFEIEFKNDELTCYREFTDEICSHISEISDNATYIDDLEQIQRKLEDAYRSFMLEKEVPDSKSVISCFILGSFRYQPRGFSVHVVRDFLQLLKSVTQEKRRIIYANFHTKLDSIVRYDVGVPF